MLDAIDEQGNIRWHCRNPECDYHNCITWGEAICEHHHHLPREEWHNGQTLTAHVSHEVIGYTHPLLVALPICECGTQMFVKVGFTKQEAREPKITRDNVGRILRVDFYGPSIYKIVEHYERDHQNNMIRIIDDVVIRPWVLRHQELHRQLEALGKIYTPPGS